MRGRVGLRLKVRAHGAPKTGYTLRYDLVEIRGFQATTGADEYLDGLKLYNGGYYATQQIDPLLLDRIDILKGPPSILYGQANPGGVIVLSAKLPTAEPIHDISLEGGTYGYVRGTIDLSGKLNDGGKFLYRLAATGFTSGTQDQHTREGRLCGRALYLLGAECGHVADGEGLLPARPARRRL